MRTNSNCRALCLGFAFSLATFLAAGESRADDVHTCSVFTKIITIAGAGTEADPARLTLLPETFPLVQFREIGGHGSKNLGNRSSCSA